MGDRLKMIDDIGVTFTLAPDGKPVDVTGPAVISGTMAALKQVSPDQMEIAQSRQGVPTGRITMTLSGDGNHTMHIFDSRCGATLKSRFPHRGVGDHERFPGVFLPSCGTKDRRRPLGRGLHSRIGTNRECVFRTHPLVDSQTVLLHYNAWITDNTSRFRDVGSLDAGQENSALLDETDRAARGEGCALRQE